MIINKVVRQHIVQIDTEAEENAAKLKSIIAKENEQKPFSEFFKTICKKCESNNIMIHDFGDDILMFRCCDCSNNKLIILEKKVKT